MKDFLIVFRVIWTQEGIENYKESVDPKLKLLHQIWLASPSFSRSTVSLALQSATRILSECAAATNRIVVTGKHVNSRSAGCNRKIKKSQNLLLQSHRNLTSSEVSSEAFLDLKNKHTYLKMNHRRTIRAENAAQSLKRDTELFTILSENPSAIYSKLRASKAAKNKKVDHIKVSDRTYLGEFVPDCFYDHLVQLKTIAKEDIQDPVTLSGVKSDFQNIIKICKEAPAIPPI